MMFDIEPMILPTPGRSFEWRDTPHGPGLFCVEIEPFASHVFTTRHWALGSRGLPADEGAAWAEVAAAIEVDARRLRRLHQVHGNDVVLASSDSRVPAADILVAGDSTYGVAVQAADCVALLLADPRTGAVAAAHAGWRGLAAGVPDVAVGAMSQRCGSRPGDLIAALGPSIGACCYEVGRDVREAFAAGFSAADLARWFGDAPRDLAGNPPMPGLARGRRSGHWFFDGWASARDQLERAGVRATRIFSADVCTASHPGAWCSYRRDGAPAGRMAAAIRSRPRRP
jgi:purine-nucleoside/S-methyl-5'-thioadenosine phosphorylase / adenosine deaminase